MASYHDRVGQNLLALGEYGLMGASAALAEPLAGIAGLMSMPYVGTDKASEAISGVRQAMTYQPRTEAARAGLEYIAPGLEAAGEWIGDASTAVEEYTGIPREAVVAVPQMAAELTPAMLALRSGLRATSMPDFQGVPSKFRQSGSAKLAKGDDVSGLMDVEMQPEWSDVVSSTKGEPVRKINEVRTQKKPDHVSVYHSTGAEFSEFDPSRGIGGQMWFTSRKDLAEAGYEGAAGSGRLVNADIDIRNPAGWDEYDKYSLDELMAQGYDGLKLVDDDQITYAAFFPEQVKVISNIKTPKK